MKTDQKKAPPEADIEALEIKLERVPVENLAEVTDTLDRVRICAQKLTGKLAEATDRYETGESDDRGYRFNSSDLERESERIGKALIVLERAMKIVVNAAAAKQKLNSGKRAQ